MYSAICEIVFLIWATIQRRVILLTTDTMKILLRLDGGLETEGNAMYMGDKTKKITFLQFKQSFITILN